MLLKRIPEAMSKFQSATKLDESSVDALTYLTYCQILQSNASEIPEQQIELLYEIQGQKTPLLCLMSAMLNRDNSEKALACLNEATGIHFDQTQHLPYSDLFLKSLNPDFLILLVKEYMLYFPPQPSFADQTNIGSVYTNEAMKKSTMILKRLTDNVPACLNGIYLLAKVQFFSEDYQAATQALQHIIADIDPSMADAHLLLARIFLQQGEPFNPL